MALIKCKMCGGDLRLEEGSTVCECEYCGTRQTVPSADNEKKLTLFSRAGRLLRGCEFDKAAGVFETIVADFPEEAEAYWGLVLCKFGIEYVDDPATGKKIPTCHRSGFDSVLDDPNFEQACENTDAVARRVYRDEARQIEDLRKRIIEVSGKEEPYDIFISYKETDEHGDRTLDSVIAQDIYTELTEKGYRVFFSRISLEDKLGTEYEPYIFAALNSAKVMLVVGTDYENFDSVWVKNEWSRFLKLITSGQKKTLIPVFKNMDAYDMPKEFAKLAAQDMGKVGAMQDLVRGVEKLINKKAAPVKETVKETVVVQQSGDGAARITAAMDRGFMALEDGEWDKAVSFFDQALSLDAKNARAYYGMALAKAQRRDADVYINMLCAGTPKAENIELPRDEKHIREAAEKYAVPGYLSAEEIRALYDYKPSYHSTLQSQKQLSAQAKKKYESDRNLTRARQFAAGEFKTELEDMRKKLFERLDKAVRNAEESSENAKQQAEKTYKSFLTNKDRLAEEKCREAGAKREADYQDAMRRFEHAKSIENYQNTKPLFIGLTPYKDSAEMAKRCDAEAARLEREAAEEAERKRKAEAEEAERQRVARDKAEKAAQAKKKRLTIAAIITIVLAVAGYFTATMIIIPTKYYNDAKALYSAEEYDAAYARFLTLKGFKDVDGLLSTDKHLLAAATAAREAKLKPFETVGSTVFFGNYEQDNKTRNGKEKIEWIVLDVQGNKSLLISKFALDCQPYNTTYKYNKKGGNIIKWEDCTLLRWLNSSFKNEAFNQDERASINKNDNSDNQIFLLSYTEIEKYLSSKNDRQCAPTAYAEAQGAGSPHCWWWIRSDAYGSSISSYAHGIPGHGELGLYSGSITHSYGVRPSLWINLASLFN